MACLVAQCSCDGFCHLGCYIRARQYVLLQLFLHYLRLRCLFPHCLSMPAAAGLTAIAASWNTKPSNWDGNDPCGDKWIGIICTGDRVTSMLVLASRYVLPSNFTLFTYTIMTLWLYVVAILWWMSWQKTFKFWAIRDSFRGYSVFVRIAVPVRRFFTCIIWIL